MTDIEMLEAFFIIKEPTAWELIDARMALDRVKEQFARAYGKGYEAGISNMPNGGQAMKEIARFDIEKHKDEHKLLKILGSNGYAVKLMDITDHGVLICKLVIVYEKEDK